MNAEFYRYPTITERDEGWGFYITGGGYVRVEPREVVWVVKALDRVV